MNNDLAEVWRNIVVGDSKSWVLFEHGTCVIVMEPEANLAGQARKLLAEWGPVHAGSSYGNFAVMHLDTFPGWIVTCHHPDILNYVPPDEFNEEEPPGVMIGMIGRLAREQDAEELSVIHVEHVIRLADVQAANEGEQES